jgi:predicted transcriptional regulator
MNEKVNLHVGSIDEMGGRFVDAWHRLERGEEVHETNLTFFDLETMMATLSAKRLELLRHVHRQPAHTVAELARALGRDYKRVHDDVTTLAHAGLLVRDEKGIRAPYDGVQANVSFESA